MQLVRWYKDEIPFLAGRDNRFKFTNSGEYIITTLMSGRFATNGYFQTEIKSLWRFVVDIENKKFDFDKIADERVHSEQAESGN